MSDDLIERAREAIAKAKSYDPAFPHGPSIKWPKVYEALRREGHDKSTAAAISNAHWNKYRRWGRAGAPGPRSAAEYEALRGRKARRRRGIPLPMSRRKKKDEKVAKIAAPNVYESPTKQKVDPELLELLRLLG